MVGPLVTLRRIGGVRLETVGVCKGLGGEEEGEGLHRSLRYERARVAICCDLSSAFTLRRAFAKSTFPGLMKSVSGLPYSPFFIPYTRANLATSWSSARSGSEESGIPRATP